MKQLLLLFLLSLLTNFSYSQTTESPCNDPKFLELKKKGVENLSESEIVYYNQKEKECTLFMNSNQSNTSELAKVNDAINQKNKSEKFYTKARNKSNIKFWLWVAFLIGGLVYLSNHKI